MPSPPHSHLRQCPRGQAVRLLRAPDVPGLALPLTPTLPPSSDLALRNCLLAADLTVKIGDYGLSHGKYRVRGRGHAGGQGQPPGSPWQPCPLCPQEDYFVTADQLWVPLRWIAPELVDEVHCNLLVVDQTKASNVW